MKTLNSLSSWPNAAPVSALLASSTVFGGILAFADDHGFENAEQLVAIRGEVLQNVDGAALVAHDRHQVDGGHLRADELFGSLQRAQLVSGPHGRHIEVEREQAAILVALFSVVSGAIFSRASRL